MAIEYIGDGSTDGTVVFQSGEKGGFFGLTTAIVQPSVTAVATTTATTTLTELKVDRLYAAMEALGLIVTAAA